MTEQIRILLCRLECISWDLKVLWIAYNVFRRKPSLGAPGKRPRPFPWCTAFKVTLSMKLQWVATTSGTRLRTIKWLSPISKQYTTISISLSKTDKYHRTIIYLSLLAGKTFISNSSIFKQGEKSNHSSERRWSHISCWGNTALWWWQFKRWGTTCCFLIMSTADNFRLANALSYLFFSDVRVIILSLRHFVQYL